MSAALDVLGDPVRRRVVEILATGDRPAGEVSAVVEVEFGISQPAVARHLRVLRDAGVVDRYRALWSQRLDALDTEIARGLRERRSTGEDDDDEETQP